jgi:protein-S-isoprenylcysteine O-methyltransferase Ste14
MLLKQRLEKVGDFFFRWRSYLPLGLIPLLMLESRYFYFGSNCLYDDIFEIACLSISMLGLTIRIITVGYSKAGTSGKNTKGQFAQSLNKDGVYSAVRNPLYIGNSFIVIGLSMLSQNHEIIIENLLLLALFYIPIILREEQFLLNTFGEEYTNYAKCTPGLLPNLRLWKRPKLKFNLIRVLYREHDAFIGIMAGFYAFEVFKDAMHEEFYLDKIDKIWTLVFVISFVIWIVLKSMKKYLKSIDKEP